MTESELYSIIIGPIKPIGVTEVDNQRLVNLQKVINLVDSLLMDIHEVSKLSSSQYSVQRAARLAKQYIAELHDL